MSRMRFYMFEGKTICQASAELPVGTKVRIGRAPTLSQLTGVTVSATEPKVVFGKLGDRVGCITEYIGARLNGASHLCVAVRLDDGTVNLYDNVTPLPTAPEDEPKLYSQAELDVAIKAATQRARRAAFGEAGSLVRGLR